MSQPTPKPLTTQHVWSRLMFTMGVVNLQRSRDARKAANMLALLRRRY